MLKRSKTYSILILTTFLYTICKAQDIHFSQFYANPLVLNPALTGEYFGNYRIHATVRTQWKSVDNKPFNTIGAGVEKKIHRYTDYFGVGLQILSDESGYVGLKSNKIFLSGSYSLPINTHEFAVGAQVGFVHKSTNFTRYTFDDQFELGGSQVFNPAYTTNETANSPIMYPLAHIGATWKKRYTNRYSSLIGASVFNLNSPYESMYGLRAKHTQLPLRSALYASAEMQVHEHIKLQPHTIYMWQRKATEFLIGTEAEYTKNKDIRPFVGTFIRYGLARNFDASTWVIGALVKQFRVGLSYDINVSSLRAATNNRGALELTCMYISPSLKSNFIKIPCDRL